MRTTVTLDPDTERMLRAAMRERGLPFKQVLNHAIRTGLAPRRPPAGSRFVQKTYRLGGDQLFRWEKALAAAGAIEDEEIGRKLALRK